MEKVTIWYSTNNDQGKKIIDAIKSLGLTVNIIEKYHLNDANILDDEINIFIFDLVNTDPKKIIASISEESRIQSSLKFLIQKKQEIKELAKLSYNILHLEFVSRPVERREFLLLLEKSIIVERYREIMKFISQEAESRIEAYEGLMDINRKNVFQSEREKEVFENILSYEKNLMREQTRLSLAIRDFTLLRHSELFDLRKRINAEEMLEVLRRQELLEAHNIIDAQESLIDYSAKELDDTRQILNARETVAELSRSEIIEITEELSRVKQLNKDLASEMESLMKEVGDLRKKAKGKSKT